MNTTFDKEKALEKFRGEHPGYFDTKGKEIKYPFLNEHERRVVYLLTKRTREWFEKNHREIYKKLEQHDRGIILKKTNKKSWKR